VPDAASEPGAAGANDSETPTEPVAARGRAVALDDPILAFVVHNWPLKLAAIGLATLLYGGLVLSQTTQPFAGNIPIQIVNAPGDVVVLGNRAPSPA
jgi:hypothetical protein